MIRVGAKIQPKVPGARYFLWWCEPGRISNFVRLSLTPGFSPVCGDGGAKPFQRFDGCVEWHRASETVETVPIRQPRLHPVYCAKRRKFRSACWRDPIGMFWGVILPGNFSNISMCVRHRWTSRVLPICLRVTRETGRFNFAQPPKNFG